MTLPSAKPSVGLFSFGAQNNEIVAFLSAKDGDSVAGSFKGPDALRIKTFL